MNANTKNNKEFLDLATYAFHKPKTKERAKAFDKLLEFSTPYGQYENQKLTSMVIDSHFNVYWKNQEVKLPELDMLPAILSFEAMVPFGN